MATVDVGTLQAILKLRDDLSSQLKTAERSLQNFGRSATRIGAGLSAAVTLPMAAIGASSLKAAMEAVESENLFQESFDGMADAARGWSEEVSKAVGSNEFTLRKNAATLFVMSESMGVAQQEAFDMSTSLTELAGDMASFYNLDHETAFLKIQAGLTGEVEPLKRLGILVNENTIKTLAYERGIAEQGATLTEVQKVQARYLAIMEQTSKAQGDLARTLDSPTNQIRIMREQANQLAIEFGTALLPVFADLLTILRDDILPVIRAFVDWFTQLDPPTQKVVVVVGALVAALGPLLVIVGQVAGAVGALIPLFSAAAPAVAGVTAALGPFAAIVAAIAGGAALGLWLRENSELFRSMTDAIGDAIAKLYTLQTGIEEGTDVTEEWTDAQKQSLVAFYDTRIAMLETAGAADELVEHFRRAKDELVGNSIIPEMLDGIQAQFGRLDQVMLNPVRHITRLVQDTFRGMASKIQTSIGGLLGNLGGMLTGFVGSLAAGFIPTAIGAIAGLFAKEEEEVNDLRDAFFAAHGGYVALQTALMGTVGAVEQQDYVKQIFDATTVEEFNAAIAQTEALLGQHQQQQQNMAEQQQELEQSFGQVADSSNEFAQQLLEQVTALIAKIEELVKALVGVGKVRIPPVNVPVSYSYPSGGVPMPGFQHGSGGFRNFGRGTPALLHGVERVQTPAQAASESGAVVSEIQGLRQDFAEMPRLLERAMRDAVAMAD